MSLPSIYFCEKCNQMKKILMENKKLIVKCKCVENPKPNEIPKVIKLAKHPNTNLCQNKPKDKHEVKNNALQEIYCVNCKKWICSECSKDHLKHKLIYNAININNSCEDNKCKKKGPIKSYCEKCQLNLCEDCIRNHNGHKTIGLDSYFTDEDYDSLVGDFKEFRNMFDSLKGSIDDVLLKIRKITETYEAAKIEYSNYFELFKTMSNVYKGTNNYCKENRIQMNYQLKKNMENLFLNKNEFINNLINKSFFDDMHDQLESETNKIQAQINKNKLSECIFQSFNPRRSETQKDNPITIFTTIKAPENLFNAEKRTTLWIDENWKDANATSKKYDNLLDQYKIFLNNHKIQKFSEVEKGIEFLQQIKFNFDNKDLDKNTNQLVYVITSGKLALSFRKKYEEVHKSLHTIPAIIIYDEYPDNYTNYDFIGDSFYNPGGITKEFEEVIKYLIEDKNKWNDTMHKPPTIKKKDSIKNEFGPVFRHIDSIEELTYPVLLGFLIGTRIVYNTKLDEFKEFVYSYGNKLLSKLVSPNQEKEINIPKYLYAKFFLLMYTLKSNFYSEMNQALTNGNYRDYNEYIYILIYALNQNALHSFSEADIYRGGLIAKKEFEEMKKELDKVKVNKGNKKINLCTFCTRTFLSFSKDPEQANKFLKQRIKDAQKNENLYAVKYIIKHLTRKDSKTFISNIDVGNNSQYPQEQEILVLPFSYFEVEGIDESNKDYKIIHLKYLEDYKEEVDKKIEDLPQEKQETFIQEAANSGSGNQMIRMMSKNIETEMKGYVKQNFFTAVYNTTKKNETIKLFGDNFTGLNESNCLLKIGEKTIGFTKNYTFPETGDHTIEIELRSKDYLKSMSFMFYGCKNLKIVDMKSFNLSQVQSMEGVFTHCSSLTGIDVSKWKVSNVENMNELFSGCSFLTELDVSNWEVGKVTNMKKLFNECSSLKKLDVSNWKVDNVTNMENLFSNCSDIKELNLKKWNTSKVEKISMLFNECKNLTKVTLPEHGFPKVVSLMYLFKDCSNLEELNLDGWEVKNITKMQSVFYGCKKLQKLDLSKWDTSKVTHFDSLFYDCQNLSNLILNKNFVTSKAIALTKLFNGCNNLKKLDLSQWDVSNVSEMDCLFSRCSSLEEIKLDGWDNKVKNVRNMEYLFDGCHSLNNLNISNWNVSKVTNMQHMFKECSSLKKLDLSKWNVSLVQNIEYMFFNCSNLDSLNVDNWNVELAIKGNRLNDAFNECNDKIIPKWYIDFEKKKK